MNREEILEKSRKENKNQDIAELELIKQASHLAAKAGILLCCILSVVDVLVTGRVNYACWMVYAGMNAVLLLVKFQKSRMREELAALALYSVIFLLNLIYYVRCLMGVI